MCRHIDQTWSKLSKCSRTIRIQGRLSAPNIAMVAPVTHCGDLWRASIEVVDRMPWTSQFFNSELWQWESHLQLVKFMPSAEVTHHLILVLPIEFSLCPAQTWSFSHSRHISISRLFFLERLNCRFPYIIPEQLINSSVLAVYYF